MPIDQEAMLAAVSGALDGDKPPEDTSEEETTDELVAEDTGDADEAGAEDAGADGESADADGDKDGEKPGAEKGAEGDKPAADGKDKKPDADGVKPTEGKKADAVNDPIDGRLKEATKERITTLITTAKTLTAERDRIASERDELVGLVLETKASPQQYGEALDLLKSLNSGDPRQQEKALTRLQEVVQEWSTVLGKVAPGSNPLAQHSDLADAVRRGELLESHAQEIAVQRNKTQLEHSTRSAQAQQQQTAEQRQTVISRGINELNALEVELKTQDPANFAYKRNILVESLKPVFAQIPPAQWKATFKAAYDKLPNAPARRVVPAVNKPPVNQPLRANNPAGGQQGAPSSLLDAISAGIENAR